MLQHHRTMPTATTHTHTHTHTHSHTYTPVPTSLPDPAHHPHPTPDPTNRTNPSHVPSVNAYRTRDQTLVQPWFVPLAYALILLHASGGGTPCVFYGDLYGSFGPAGARPAGTFALPAHRAAVVAMVLARRRYAYGPQSEYLHHHDDDDDDDDEDDDESDDPRCVGFTRHGHPRRSAGAGLAVVLSAAAGQGGGGRKTKRMYVGAQHAGERWTDILGAPRRRLQLQQDGECEKEEGGEEVVVIDEHGWGTFSAGPRSVAVWVDRAAEGRDEVDRFEL